MSSSSPNPRPSRSRAPKPSVDTRSKSPSTSTPSASTSSKTTKSPTSPRPLPHPRPALTAVSSSSTPADSNTNPRKEKKPALSDDPNPHMFTSNSPPSSARPRAISHSSVKGPRVRANTQTSASHQSATSPTTTNTSPRVFISSNERSPSGGSGSPSTAGMTRVQSSSTAKLVSSSSSSTSIPVLPAKSPLRNANNVKSPDTVPVNEQSADVSSQQRSRSRSTFKDNEAQPQQMVSSSTADHGPTPGPAKGIQLKSDPAPPKTSAEAESTEIASSMTTHDLKNTSFFDHRDEDRMKSGVTLTQVAATSSTLLSSSISVTSNSSSSLSPPLSSSSSASRSKPLTKLKSGGVDSSVTMVRSAITRSQSASASTTTVPSPIGPRPPSSHKFPSVFSCAPSHSSPKDKLNRQTSAEAALPSTQTQRPSTSASASVPSSSQYKFATISASSSSKLNSRHARPSTAAASPSSSSSIPTPISTPAPRGRGRSGTVVPSSSSPSTSHRLSPTSPQNSPQTHSILSSPLSSMLTSTPLSRSHRSSTASEVSPVHLKRLLAKPAEASVSAYGSGSESDALKGGGGGNGGISPSSNINIFQRKKMANGSDSEGYKSAPGAIGGGRASEMKGRQRRLAEMQKALAEDEEEKDEPERITQPALRLVQSLDTPPSPPADPKVAKTKGMSLPELEKVNEKERRIRNVLKRRPSTAGGFGFLRRPTTPGKAIMVDSIKSSTLLTSPTVQSPTPLSPHMLHSPRIISKSRSPSRNRSLDRDRNTSGPPSANSIPPRSLTPAAQLALAYREQEARRDDLAGSALGHYPSPAGSGSHSGNTSASASVVSVVVGESTWGNERGGDYDHGRGRSEGAVTDGERDVEPGTPYYTVFGSTSGRVVAVGSPYDAWGYDVDWTRGRGRNGGPSGVGRRGTSLDGRGKDGKDRPKSRGGIGGVGRTLSRKVSGRWKRGGDGSGENEPHGEKDGVAGPEKGDGEMGVGSGVHGEDGERQKEREKGWSFGKAHKRRSLRLSIDKFADTDDVPLPILPSDPSKVDEARRKSEPGFLSGGKIWKLMKRISTGGLRDRYTDEVPPPVPALPKDLLTKAGHVEKTADQKPLELARYTSRHSSASVSTDPPLKKHATAVAKLSSTGAVVSAPRQSLNTRSSSPVSSELASLRFFRGTHSSRSSTSSLFEDDDAPPLPMPSMIGQHIIPPSEFNRADTSEESVPNDKDKFPTAVITKKPSLPLKLPEQRHSRLPSPDDWFAKSPAEEKKPSLPLPPRDRKQQKSDTKEVNRPPSPIIPSFSTTAPINDFAPRKPSLKPQRASVQPPAIQSVTVPTEMGTSAPLLSTPPPARPSRSTKRPSPNTSASSSRVTSPIRGTEPPGLPSSLRETAEDVSRKSLGNRSTTSTYRGRHRSSSPTTQRRTMIYRELNPTQKSPMLSEKEKNDKWNDLLERSAQAGGTLHIGGTALLSDQLSDRLSYLSMDSALS